MQAHSESEDSEDDEAPFMLSVKKVGEHECDFQYLSPPRCLRSLWQVKGRIEALLSAYSNEMKASVSGWVRESIEMRNWLVQVSHEACDWKQKAIKTELEVNVYIYILMMKHSVPCLPGEKLAQGETRSRKDRQGALWPDATQGRSLIRAAARVLHVS